MLAPQKYAWWIPVTYVPIDTSFSSGSANVSTGVLGEESFVEMKDCTAEAPWPDGGDAIKVNSGQFGVYRCDLHIANFVLLCWHLQLEVLA